MANFIGIREYPIKAICRRIKDILELDDDFTTNQAKQKLKEILNDNIEFIDMNNNNLINKNRFKKL